MNDTTPDKRIPVYLLTGYLGSGKTSLLKSWLTQDEMKEAALVINELGEVGLDNQLLSGATESSALVANACVCCTGLPGLAEALEDLFWARLERRMHRFPNVVIETTGLAEPGPVAEALASSDLLKERYRLAGVITCLSARTADAVLKQHAEARAQLAGADLLVITKTDTVSPESLAHLRLRLQHQLEHLNLPDTPRVLTSSHANLSAKDVLAHLASHKQHSSVSTVEHPLLDVKHHHHAHDHHHDHTAHDHAAKAIFCPVQAGMNVADLLDQITLIQQALAADLMRLKGRVDTLQGRYVIQLAPFELAPEVLADGLAWDDATRSGLTLIVSTRLSAESQTQLAKSAAYFQGSMVM
jgi:G3E family GTPase